MGTSTINQCNEEKADWYNVKIANWQRDIVDKRVTLINLKQPMKQGFLSIENSFSEYWCQGDECKCDWSH
jgi:hypothetical protein